MAIIYRDGEAGKICSRCGEWKNIGLFYRRLISADGFRKEREAGGGFTAEEWETLKGYYNYTCLCCRRREPEIKLSPDHVIPLGPSGTGEIWNVQPLCLSCNSRKGAKTIDYRPAWEEDMNRSSE